MRERIFALAPRELGLAPGPGHTRVWAVLMETGYAEAVASLLAVVDGTTSIYFSTGGGVIGAGQHDAVRDAAQRFITLVDAQVESFEPTTEHPLPDVGRVRFYVLTFEGLRTEEAGDDDLGENRHPLSPLFHAGHAVITAVREAEEQG